jgi:hypothetical protein
MPLIKARSSSIISNVDLRGQPTAPTAQQSTNTNQLASTAFVRAAISELIDSSPDLLNTLNELAQAIGDDANFATTITNSIATKLPKDGSEPMTGELILSGAPVNALAAVTKQYVDDLIDSQMIYSTDDVTEGTANLYYTDARVRSAVSLYSDNTSVLSYDYLSGQFTYNHPDSDGVLEGQTNRYFTEARARGSVSLTSDDNTIISYSTQTGVFTFTTPDTDKIVEGATNQYFTTTRARNSVSGGANIDYDSGTGIFSTQAAVWSVNGQEHNVVLDTDDISEGSANQYFTDARAATAIKLTTDDTNILSYNTGTGRFTFVKPNTDAISEGGANLYYTDTRVRAAVSASGDISYNGATGNFSYSTPTTDGVNEGSVNQYYLDSRARNAISLTTNKASVLDYDSATGEFTFDLSNQTTDDVAEGATNQYYLDSRARASISTAGWTNLSYNSGTGVITIAAPSTTDVTEGSNLYFTTTRARDSVNASKIGGDGSFSYDSATGVFSYTGPDDADYRQAVSANINSGDGSLSYSSATGVFTYDGPTNSDYRGAVSAFKASGDGNLSYDGATGVFTYTGPSANEVRAHLSATTSGTGFGGLTYDDATGIFTYAKVTSGDVRGELSATTSGTGHGGLTYDSTLGQFTFAKVTAANIRGELNATTATGVTYNSSTGTIALASIPNSSLTNSDITINGATIALGGSATLTADDIAEAAGGTNKYYTEARFNTSLATKTTDDVTEGANLYYTQARFNSAFAAKSTSDLTEGSNLYYTTARTRADVGAGTGVSYNSSTGVFSIGQSVGTTDNVTFNDVTVGGDLTVLGTLTSIQSNTVEIADLNLTLAKGSANATQANGAGLTVDGANATITYASGTDSWNFNKDVSVTGGLSLTGSLTAPTFVGNLTGDVTGNVTGNLTGDVTGNVTGDVTSTGTSTFSTVDINGGNIDGTVIGGATPAAVTGTSVTATTGFSGDLTGNVTGNLTGNVTGDVTGNLTGNVTGQVSDLSNHTTSDVAEGSNLYFTNARAQSAISAGNTGIGFGTLSYDSATGAFSFAKVTSADVRGTLSAVKVSGDGNFSYSSATGEFSYTGTTDADYRDAVSAVKVSGDGNFSYDSSTGVFSYTGPSAGDTRAHFSAVDTGGDGSFGYDQATGVFTYTGPSAAEVRAHISAVTAEGVTFSAGGAIGLANVPNSSLANSDITINGTTIALGGSDSIDTDAITEGATNQYFLDSRARNAISLTTSDSTVLSYDSVTGVFDFDLGGMDTDEVAEGTTNLYFTQARARASISASGWGNLSYDNTSGVITITAPSTTDVTEGTNLYFTDSRARQAVSLTTDNSNALSYDNTTGVFTFTLNSVNTDEIVEGSTNLYFTTSRARNSISNGANIDYDATSGVISTQAAVWSVNGQTHDVVLDTDDITEGSANLYFLDSRARSAITLSSDNTDILSYSSGTGALTFVTPTTDAISEGLVNLYYTDLRADGRIAAASIRDLADVDADDALQDGYTLVWSSVRGEFVPQNIAVTATTLNFTGDGTTSSFNTGVEVTSIDNTQVYINGLIQAPTYSYTINTTSGVTSIVFDTAPEANDYIFVRVSSTSSLTAGGVLNESSTIDGGSY